MDPIVIPESLAELSVEDMKKLYADARTYLVESAKGDITLEQAEELAKYADALRGLKNEITSREDAEKALDESLKNLVSEFEEAVEEVEEPVEEPEVVVEEVVEEEVKEPVTAGARPVIRRAKTPEAPKDPEPTSPKIDVYAAAETSFNSGTKLDGMLDVAKAFIARSRGAKNGTFSVAEFHFPNEFSTHKDMSEYTIQELVDKAGNEARLPGKSLVAAGGWCKPSELILDLCPGGVLDGLFDLPEINISGGGVRYMNPIDYSALYAANGPGFYFTEAQMIAGMDKTCVTLSCPTTSEIRLDASGYCVEVPIPMQSAWPEPVAQFLREVQMAYQANQSARVLQKVLTAAGAAENFGGLGSAVGGVLHALELVIERERQHGNWGLNETAEVVVPSWLRGAMRADYSMRNGVDLQNVTDAILNGYFAARKARVQYVKNWQKLAANARSYPANVQILVYRAGTFVKGVHPVLSLSAMHSPELLKQNVQMAAFFEQGILVLQRCAGATLINVPVCVAGRTGSADVVCADAAAA